MARTKNKPVFTSPRWQQALKALFLHFAFHHRPEALRRLVTEVRNNAITPQDWANLYGVAGTWVEVWVADTLEAWKTQPYLLADLDQAGNTVLYPPPRDESTADDVFSFSVSAIPLAKLSLGITMGGSLPDGQPEDDWLRFKEQIHRSLESALESYRQRAAQLGASREVLVPKDLLLKTEATAVYFFCGKNPGQLLKLLKQKVGDRTTVYRWIREIAKLLEMPMKRRRD